MQYVFLVLVGLALALVAATLGAGVYSLMRGGDFARTWSNRLMRLRVFFQLCAVIIIAAFLFWRGSAH